MKDDFIIGPYIAGPNDRDENGIYTGDSADLAAALPDDCLDVAIFDPPYGVAWQSNLRQVSEQFRPMAGDGEINTAWLPELVRVLKPVAAAFIFTRWDVMPEWKQAMENVGLTVKNCIVWDKGYQGAGDLYGAFAPQHEMILFGVRGRYLLNKRLPDVVRVNRIQPNELLHPAQKPVRLIAHLLRGATRQGDVVGDWFAGSGTVSVACKQMGRRSLAFEIDPAYAEEARQRVRETQRQLFDTTYNGGPEAEQLSWSLDKGD